MEKSDIRGFSFKAGDGDTMWVQVPSVGRMVHYFAYGTPNGEFPAGVARAAVVTEVDEPSNPESTVGLAVLNPQGLFFNQHILYGPGIPGHWGWPVAVPSVPVK